MELKYEWHWRGITQQYDNDQHMYKLQQRQRQRYYILKLLITVRKATNNPKQSMIELSDDVKWGRKISHL